MKRATTFALEKLVSLTAFTLITGMQSYSNEETQQYIEEQRFNFPPIQVERQQERKATFPIEYAALPRRTYQVQDSITEYKKFKK